MANSKKMFLVSTFTPSAPTPPPEPGPNTRQSTTMGYVLPAVIKGVLSGEISWDTLGQRPPEDTCCPGRRLFGLRRGVGCEPGAWYSTCADPVKRLSQMVAGYVPRGP